MNDLSGPAHERLRDDLAAYSLGALDGPEARAVEAHLEDCESCREWLHWLRPAVDVLPASVQQEVPPESLRERLMATVRAEAESAPEPAAPRRRLVPARWSFRPAAAMAAIALLAAGVGVGYAVGGSDEPAPQFVEADVPPALVDDVAATLERSGDSAILHVEKLPPIRGDEVYEVWVQQDGRFEPSSLFLTHRDGTAEAAIATSLAGADAVMVTREPRAGSAQPTSAALLTVPLS